VRKYILAGVVVTVAVLSLILQARVPHPYRNMLVPVLEKGWHLALFGAMWLAAYFVGRRLLVLMGYRRRVPPELALAGGIIIFSLLSLALAAAQVAYGWVVKLVVVGVLAAGCYPWARRLGGARARVRRWLAELEVGPAVLLVFGAMLIVPIALCAAQPPIYWDALTYHLAVPQAYAQGHGFVYLPYNIYASMPMGATMFYLWGILWDGLTNANASYFVVSLIVVALVYRLARFWLSQFYAATAAFLVFLTPLFFDILAGANVDHFLILYVVAALYFYFLPDGEPGSARRAVAVGFFLGAALAVKYTSVYAWAAFIPILIYDLTRRRVRLRQVAVIFAIGFVFIAPWLVKAYVERGNPVFPLLYNVFGGRDFSAEQVRRLVTWQYEMGAGRAWFDYLLLPYRITVYSGYDYKTFAGIYFPYLLPLAALAIWAFRRAGRLVVFGWAYFLFWALGPQQLRFLGGGFAALAVAAAATLQAAEGRFDAGARTAWRITVVAGITFTGLAFNIGGLVNNLSGFSYLAGRDRETFLENSCGFYRAQKFINEELPADAKILMIFTNHTLYLKKDAVYDSFFEASPFLMAAEEGADAEGLYRLARRWGITHVHVFHYYKAWGNYPPAVKEIFYRFLVRYSKPVYRDTLNDIYELEVVPGD